MVSSSRAWRWARRLGLAGLLLGSVAGGGAWFLVRRQLPDDATAPLAGLKGEVTVAVDGRGVPTLKAADLFDAFRVQGFETARERMFQMELMRRSAEGRLSELVGAGALPLVGVGGNGPSERGGGSEAYRYSADAVWWL